MATYAHTTLAQARAQLAARLNDGDMQFWNAAELDRYIVESLRSWNAYSNFWRQKFVMNSSTGVVWYDITDAAVAPNTLRPLTVTDVDLYKIIENHLLEPPSGAIWSGSTQFTIDDIMQALARRRDETLSNTGCYVSRSTPGAAAGVVRTTLPDTVIDIRRLAWLPAVAGYSKVPIFLDDQWADLAFDAGYMTADPGVPSTYRKSSEPPLSFDVNPPPVVPGLYEVLSVDAGAALDVNNPTLLKVPDDFTWILKWGVLADVLGRESNAKDPLRAQYAAMRYQQGMAMLMNAPAILSAAINGVARGADAAYDLDTFRTLWMSETPTTPDTIVIGGLNLIGLAAPPSAGPFSILLNVVQNAPVPVVDGDYVEIARDDYDVMLDNAQHLASFKMGGSEFAATIPLMLRMIKQASIYNSKLTELGEFTASMLELSRLQDQFSPTMANREAVSGGQQ